MVLLASSSMLVNQQYILNKVSLNRSTHKTRLCIGWGTKMCPEAHGNLMLYFLQGQWFSICSFHVCGNFIAHGYCG